MSQETLRLAYEFLDHLRKRETELFLAYQKSGEETRKKMRRQMEALNRFSQEVAICITALREEDDPGETPF